MVKHGNEHAHRDQVHIHMPCPKPWTNDKPASDMHTAQHSPAARPLHIGHESTAHNRDKLPRQPRVVQHNNKHVAVEQVDVDMHSTIQCTKHASISGMHTTERSPATSAVNTKRESTKDHTKPHNMLGA